MTKYVPLSTERGWDRIMNYEVSSARSYAIVPGRELWSPCFWEFQETVNGTSPVALYMGHDKVAFHCMTWATSWTTRRWPWHCPQVTSCRCHWPGTPEGARYRWMQWLDTLQKQVASQYMLEPLDSFRHLRQLALEACYGPLTVVGSLEKEPVTVGSVELASPGYYVAREDGTLEAGRLVKYSGQSYDQAAPLEFVRRRQGKQEQWWLYGTGRVVLPAGTATRAAVKIPEGEVPAALIERDGVRWVEAQAPRRGSGRLPQLHWSPPSGRSRRASLVSSVWSRVARAQAGRTQVRTSGSTRSTSRPWWANCFLRYASSRCRTTSYAPAPSLDDGSPF